MKRGILYLMLVCFGTIALFSCESEEEYYSLDDVWLSMGMVQKPDSTGNDFFVIIDNGDTLLPLANSVSRFETFHQQRVVVNYTILGDANQTKNKFWVKINNLYDVLLKNILLIDRQKSDSLGNDPINIDDIWLAGNYLNLELSFLGGGKVHWVNLVCQSPILAGAQTPVELELRHNARNDTLGYLLRGIVTFDLSDLSQVGRDSVEFNVNWKNLKLENKSYSGTFRMMAAQPPPGAISILTDDSFMTGLVSFE